MEIRNKKNKISQVLIRQNFKQKDIYEENKFKHESDLMWTLGHEY